MKLVFFCVLGDSSLLPFLKWQSMNCFSRIIACIVTHGGGGAGRRHFVPKLLQINEKLWNSLGFQDLDVSAYLAFQTRMRICSQCILLLGFLDGHFENRPPLLLQIGFESRGRPVAPWGTIASLETHTIKGRRWVSGFCFQNHLVHIQNQWIKN